MNALFEFGRNALPFVQTLAIPAIMLILFDYYTNWRDEWQTEANIRRMKENMNRVSVCDNCVYCKCKDYTGTSEGTVRYICSCKESEMCKKGWFEPILYCALRIQKKDHEIEVPK